MQIVLMSETRPKTKMIVDHYGQQDECHQLQEECGELITELAEADMMNNRMIAGLGRLIKELNHFCRKEKTRMPEEGKAKIATEIADVLVSIENVIYAIGLDTDEIMQQMEEKRDRQIRRIKGESN